MANQIEIVEKNCQIDSTLEEKILQCANSRYQFGLLVGWFKWSGADLKGKALHWKYKYNYSALNLLKRIQDIGRENNIKLELKPQMNTNRRWQTMLIAQPFAHTQEN